MNLKYTLLLIFSVSFLSVNAQYYTGQKVFSNKFPSEKIDYSQDTYLKIDNSCNGCNDIIVAIENVYTRKVIRHAYINSGDIFDFNYIPVGTYICKYMWTDRYGRKNYQKDDSSFSYGVDEVGGYIITLEQTRFGNLSQSSIDEDEFFD